VPTEDPQELLRDVGRRVAELRAEQGLTQEALAEKLGVSTVYVRRVELGRENLTVRSLARLATFLSVRTVDLFAPPQSREVRVGRPRRTRSNSPSASPSPVAAEAPPPGGDMAAVVAVTEGAGATASGSTPPP